LSFEGGFDEGRLWGIDGVHEIITSLIHRGFDISTREKTRQIVLEIVVQERLPGSEISIITNKQSLPTFGRERRTMSAASIL
jgi:hypothetical protein